jgi:hypothetical protein
MLSNPHIRNNSKHTQIQIKKTMHKYFEHHNGHTTALARLGVNQKSVGASKACAVLAKTAVGRTRCRKENTNNDTKKKKT